jgi:hypothetical protein
MMNSETFIEKIEALPPHRRDAVLIILKMGTLLVLSLISSILTALGSVLGMPWGLIFFIPSLLVIGVMFFLIFYMMRQAFKELR